MKNMNYISDTNSLFNYLSPAKKSSPASKKSSSRSKKSPASELNFGSPLPENFGSPLPENFNWSFMNQPSSKPSSPALSFLGNDIIIPPKVSKVAPRSVKPKMSKVAPRSVKPKVSKVAPRASRENSSSRSEVSSPDRKFAHKFDGMNTGKKDPKGRVIYEGKRGGLYVISNIGKRVPIVHEKTHDKVSKGKYDLAAKSIAPVSRVQRKAWWAFRDR